MVYISLPQCQEFDIKNRLNIQKTSRARMFLSEVHIFFHRAKATGSRIESFRDDDRHNDLIIGKDS